jgi:DNA-binding phage protein
MSRRSRDWNGQLARDLQDPAFAKEFLLAALVEGVTLHLVLGKMIRVSGVKEFSRRARMASPNILRAINPRHNPSTETLDRLLEPLGLKLGSTVLDKSSQHVSCVVGASWRLIQTVCHPWELGSRTESKSDRERVPHLAGSSGLLPVRREAVPGYLEDSLTCESR